MPNFKMSVPHSLGKEEAMKRLKRAAEKGKKQFSQKVTIMREDWHEDRGEFEVKAMGFQVSGLVTVEDSQILIDSTIPFAALPFKGRIESLIKEKARDLLA
jgi:hypothetical protein